MDERPLKAAAWPARQGAGGGERLQGLGDARRERVCGVAVVVEVKLDLTETSFDQRRELVEAMRTIAKAGTGPATQIPSVGCSIKWK